MVASLPAEAWTVLHNYLSAVTGQGIDPNAAGSSTGPGTFSGAASAAGMLATIQAEWDDPTPAEDFDETTPLIDGVEEAAEAPGGMCGIGYCDLAQGCGGAECGCFPLLEAVGWAIMFGLSQASSVVGRCLQSRGPLDFWDM